MEKHRGEYGGQQNDIKDGWRLRWQWKWPQRLWWYEDIDDNDYDDEDADDEDATDENADDKVADGEDADGEDADDEDATDAKTTISCLYRLHDAASGCDVLQTIWSICLSYTWRW